MKKYLLGIIAVAMAIGFSSFSSGKTIVKQKNSVTLNYWNYNPSTGLGLFMGEFEVDSPELEAVTCPNNGLISCAKGYNPAVYDQFNPPAGSQVITAAQDNRTKE